MNPPLPSPSWFLVPTNPVCLPDPSPLPVPGAGHATMRPILGMYMMLMLTELQSILVLCTIVTKHVKASDLLIQKMINGPVYTVYMW